MLIKNVILHIRTRRNNAGDHAMSFNNTGNDKSKYRDFNKTHVNNNEQTSVRYDKQTGGKYVGDSAARYGSGGGSGNVVNEAHLRAKLISMLGKKIVDDWFGEFKMSIDGVRVCILLPDIFMRDWINTHYIDQLYVCLRELMQVDCHICLDVMEKAGKKSGNGVVSGGSSAVGLNGVKNSEGEERNEDSQEKVDVEEIVNTGKYTFDNFIVGKTNEMAHAAALKICELVINNKPLQMNPLFIYGEPGVGKSHLLSAIKHHLQEHRPDIKITHMTAAEFMYEFIKALKDREGTMSFKEGLRSSKILLIDDVQFIIGKNSTQEEFFHTFNYLREKYCQIVLSSDKPAYKLDGLEERLKSRLGWGLTVEIHQPHYELRLAIIQHKAEVYNVHIDAQAMEFLASQIHGNLRDLEGAWHRILTYSQWLNQDINVAMVRQVLGEMIKHEQKIVSIKDIQDCIAQHYDVTVQALQSGGRKQNLVRARHLGIFLAREMTESSLVQIANAFGGRDHTAVMYGVKKIKDELGVDRQLAQDLEKLKDMLQKIH